MTLVNSIASLTLDLPPSCIAFCPRRPQLFVVGTYQLHREEQEGDLSGGAAADALPDDDDATIEQKAHQKRTGSLILFHLDHDNNITRLSTTSTDFAILDIQWSPHPEALGGGDVLAVAASTGLLAFYRLDACGSSETHSGSHVKDYALIPTCAKTIADSSTLVLSLTWHPFRPSALGLTLSDGRVCVCESGDGALWSEDADVKVSDVHQHSLEAWTLAFNPAASHQQVLSGGDDIVLQCSHTNDDQTSWQDRRLHHAGITAILPLSETLVITGSYDDHIRLLSCPIIGRRQCLAELHLGGGVWRLKKIQDGDELQQQQQPDSSSSASALPATAASSSSSVLLLLASCMHAGSRIVKLIREGEGEAHDVWRFEVLARFEEHQSMNYGSDIQPMVVRGGAEAKKRIVSTSFYDKLLCLWEFDV